MGVLFNFILKMERLGSGIFNCRICEECFYGSMYENGWNDNEGLDDVYAEECRVKMEEYYQRAVNLGRKIKGYIKND